MQIGALFSGGKDSVYSIFKAINAGHQLRCLITIFSDNPESYMYHVPNIELTLLQAEAMGVPIITRNTKGVKEKELEDLEIAINQGKKKYHIQGLVNGAIYSNYQRRRIEQICTKSGLDCITPLWKLIPKDVLVEMVNQKFKVIMSAVAAGGLGPEWLGEELTLKAINKLAHLHETCYVCTGGEGGEFETLVIDSPLFKKQLKIIEADPIWDGQAGVYRIKKAVLIDK
jgi:asparagine synthase (glutamine-hydrolysing)